MTSCRIGQLHLDGKLSSLRDKGFLKHQEECDHCSNLVNSWSRARAVLHRSVDQTQSKHVAPSELNVLFEKARGGHKNHRFVSLKRKYILTNTAVAAAIIVGLAIPAWLAVPSIESSTQLQSPQVAATNVHHIEQPTLHISTSKTQQIPLTKDSVKLAPASQLAVFQESASRVSLALLKGSAQFSVQKRPKGEHFAVRAGELLVQVVGTRFEISKRDPSNFLLVFEGAVEVRHDNGKKWLVSALQKLVRDADGVYRIKSFKEPRQNLLAGEKRHHKRRATKLSAQDCQSRFKRAVKYKKRKNWTSAVSQYDTIIQSCRPEEALQAQFLAAKLQLNQLKQYAEATKRFKAIVDNNSASVLLPDTRLGLARSLYNLGQTKSAKQMFCTIVAEHPGSAAAVQVRGHLEEQGVDCAP